MMKLSVIFKLFIYALIFFSFIWPETGNAIPAFARKYKISCNTCHTVFPRLKAYGDEFAGNGFIIKEKENERDYVTAGDDLLWLNKDFPVAARIDLIAAHEQGQKVENDLRIPWGLKLLSGGTLYKNIGYYFYFYMQEHGKIAGVEDAYIHFDNIFNTNLDVMVGQFQICDPLMKRELRLTYEDYMIYKTKIGNSTINLAYDRGLILAYGIEKSGTDIVAMIVNGNGIPEEVDGKLDQDNHKNIGLRVNQSIADFLSIGGFYYFGKENSPDTSLTNQVTYYGPDIILSAGPFELTAQYLMREDDNPYFTGSASKIKTEGYVAELVFSPDIERSRYCITGLYNLVDSEYYKYETATLSYTYQLARNLRLLTEYTRDLNEEKNRFVLGVISAF
ncbi:MAG: hypothetical protein JXR46_13025 [Calditrichaceae bacterium]|nr:hypothetical protein [Calditrichaceae bacterium]MBN2709957.1 hypothetical protein [Calditrichaceae bacterium]RQV94215.1 MAG: hypothetical protein EH224_10675 [Calditrichota bacterium]